MEVLALRDAVAATDPAFHAAICQAMEVVRTALHVYRNGGTPATCAAAEAAAAAAFTTAPPVAAGGSSDERGGPTADGGGSRLPPADTPAATAAAEAAASAAASAAATHKQPELVFSFNGGKDSTVVLHIIRAVLAESGCGDKPCLDARLPVVYFAAANDFPEVLAFMAECGVRYGFHTAMLPPFKAGLTHLIAQGARAVLLGQRATDPDAALLDAFTPTSRHWPPIMRVCPILRWPYRYVWRFLRGAALPYCSLYDAGYTSLGSTTDSVPNPALRLPGSGGGGVAYAPAYALEDDRYERLGRSGRRVTAAPPLLSAAVATLQPTAAIIVIGDEVLSGRVRDANGPYLSRRLSERGVRVSALSIVSDDAHAIATAVAAAAPTVDYVLTAGGLGPTHDDVTLPGVARAFGYRLARCTALAAMLEHLLAAPGAPGHTPNKYWMRMADLPSAPDAVLLYPDGTRAPAFPDDPAPTADAPAALLARGYPLLRVRNVYTFPGMPSLLRRKWRAHGHHFVGPPVCSGVITVAATKADIAGHMEAALEVHPSVHLGSYADDDDEPPHASLHGDATPALSATAPAASTLPPALAAAGGGGGGMRLELHRAPPLAEPPALCLRQPGAAALDSTPHATPSPAALAAGHGLVHIRVTAVGDGAEARVVAACTTLREAFVAAGLTVEHVELPPPLPATAEEH